MPLPQAKLGPSLSRLSHLLAPYQGATLWLVGGSQEGL